MRAGGWTPDGGAVAIAMQPGQTAPAPGAAGYWGRDAKNKRVWVPADGPRDELGPATVQAYLAGEQQARGREHARQRAEEQRRGRPPYVNCFRNFTPRSDSALTSRSQASLASSIAFSNNPWEGKPKIGGTHVYTRVGSLCFRAPSFEPADCRYERTRPPDIPNTSTSQGASAPARAAARQCCCRCPQLPLYLPTVAASVPGMAALPR